VFADGPCIALFEKALEFRGIHVENLKKPYRELSSEETAKLRESLRELGVIQKY